MAQRIVVVHLEIEVRILAAEVEVGLVELEQRARVDEASSDGHVVAQCVGDHRADLEGVALRFDAFDDQKPVGFVRMGRVGSRSSEYPLSARDEEVVRVGQTALLAHFIDCERAFLSDAVGREGRVLRCLLRTQRLSRTCEIQQGQERADGYFAHCRAFSR